MPGRPRHAWCPPRHVPPRTLAAVVLVALLLVTLAAACGPRDPRTLRAPAAARSGVEFECRDIGTWRHEHHEYGSEITLCLEPDGTPWVRQAFADGTLFESVLVPVFSATGDRYRREVEYGDYYEVRPDGSLALGDDEGEIVTIDPVP